MIEWVLEIFFILLTGFMMAYLVRHYIFTLTVLRGANRKRKPKSEAAVFEPTVSIIIPALTRRK